MDSSFWTRKLRVPWRIPVFDVPTVNRRKVCWGCLGLTLLLNVFLFVNMINRSNFRERGSLVQRYWILDVVMSDDLKENVDEFYRASAEDQIGIETIESI